MHIYRKQLMAETAMQRAWSDIPLQKNYIFFLVSHWSNDTERWTNNFAAIEVPRSQLIYLAMTLINLYCLSQKATCILLGVSLYRKQATWVSYIGTLHHNTVKPAETAITE
jgi:hypothetical protein